MVTTLDKLTKLRTDLPFVKKEKPPSTWADEILHLKTKEERIAALKEVPDDSRHIVKFYVTTEYCRRTGKPLPDLNPKAGETRTEKHA